MNPDTIVPQQQERRIAAALAILRVLDRSDATGRHVSEAVEQDPEVAAQIMKMIRSPLCGVRSPNVTLARAVVLLGFVTTRKLVIVSLCRSIASIDAIEGERWLHALWVGVAAEEIARRLDPSVSSQAFMAGMTHSMAEVIDHYVDPAMSSEKLVDIEATVDLAHMARYVAGAEAVATAIFAARPGLPAVAVIDVALESGGLMPMQDGKLAVDVRRGYDLYANLLS